jgi:hypothetical protein
LATEYSETDVNSAASTTFEERRGENMREPNVFPLNFDVFRSFHLGLMDIENNWIEWEQ